MMGKRRFELTVIHASGGPSRNFVVTAYEPYPDAPFVAQKRDDGWSVTHRGTTSLVTRPLDTLKAALEAAAEIEKACPSCRRVKAKHDDNGRVKYTGPHRKLRAEVAAYHASLRA